MASPSLPSNVHISHHPCLRAKLSQLRSQHANARETKALIHEIALIVGCQALERGLATISSGTVRGFHSVSDTELAVGDRFDERRKGDGVLKCLRADAIPSFFQDKSPLGYEYETQTIWPARIALVPILRSGLGMLDALQTLLPTPVPVHHLGLYREPTTLQPVEYYNNLPYHSPSSTTTIPPHPPQSPFSSSTTAAAAASSSSSNAAAPQLAILLDPLIATGGTSVAAIQTLREWGVERVVVISVLGSEAGVRRAAEEWREGVEVWVGGVDAEVDGRGMIVPGLGDVGDRLFLTRGK